MKKEYIGANNMTKYVFNNSSETPQCLIEFVTTINTCPRLAFGHFRLQIDGLKQNFEKKLYFQ